MKFPLLIVVLFLFSSCSYDEGQQSRIDFLEAEIQHLQGTNNNLLDRLSDLSVINKSDAESIKSSLSTINEQYGYIEELSDRIQQRDSLNMALAANLKSSLHSLDDEDVNVEIKGNAVFVSLSENLLFKTGSTKVNKSALGVLRKISKILNDHHELELMVLGHTDDVPIANLRCKDNWDLSVLRATSVARVLQTDFLVYPDRITAAGKGEYVPINDNELQLSRADNRRTEIIIMPSLNQFFELLRGPELMS